MVTLDAVERAGAGAAICHLEKAAAYLHEACHQLYLAETYSRLAEPTPTMTHHAAGLQLAISRKRDTMQRQLAQAASCRIWQEGNVIFLMRATT